jgi:hypothetical protein
LTQWKLMFLAHTKDARAAIWKNRWLLKKTFRLRQIIQDSCEKVTN